jgi:hypothetical protein
MLSVGWNKASNYIQDRRIETDKAENTTKSWLPPEPWPIDKDKTPIAPSIQNNIIQC